MTEEVQVSQANPSGGAAQDEPVDRAEQMIKGVAAVFDRAALTYDSVGVPWFTPIAQRLVAELAPAPGQRVLDVGTGRGAALFPLARAVAPTGSVVGIDISPGMITATQRDVEAQGLGNVELLVDNAAAPDLVASSFDLVAASLVLFFLPDPAAGLRAWRELLVPGGRIGISTFGERDPGWEEVDRVFRPYLPPEMLDPRTSGRAGPFASDEGVESLMSSCGFEGMRTISFTTTVLLTDVAHWSTWTWSHGQRLMWELTPEENRAAVLEEAGELLQACRRSDGLLHLDQGVRLTLARRPST